MSMKPHVLMTMTSAPFAPSPTRAPAPASHARIRSLSTVFLSQPSVTSPTRGPRTDGAPPAGCTGCLSTGRARVDRLWSRMTRRLQESGLEGGRIYARRGERSTPPGRAASADSAALHDACVRRRREAEQLLAERPVDLEAVQLDEPHVAVLFRDLEAADQVVAVIHPDPEPLVPLGLLRHQRQDIRIPPADHLAPIQRRIEALDRVADELAAQVHSARTLFPRGRPHHLERIHARV